MTDYDEDTIVQLITELYHLFIKLCTIEEDQVAFPPDGGHRINEELCESLHIDSAVVSLMKRLPYPKKRETQLYFCLLLRGMPLVYIDDRDIICGRDVENAPFGGIEPLRLEWMLPHDVALTLQNDREGASVILDTKESKSRDFNQTTCLLILSSRHGPNILPNERSTPGRRGPPGAPGRIFITVTGVIRMHLHICET